MRKSRGGISTWNSTRTSTLLIRSRRFGPSGDLLLQKSIELRYGSREAHLVVIA